MADKGGTKKSPGKLKFNPMMFNPGALRPGAKNAKLDALKNKRDKEQEAKSDEAATAAFSRPSRPKRRTKSKRSLPMEDLDVEEMKHAFTPSLTMDDKDTTTDETKQASSSSSSSTMSTNLPRVYADANKEHHLDVDNLEIEVESTDDWKIFQRIGRGKYSEVFEGKQMSTGVVACVKILKPCLPKLLKLEIYTLQLLKHGPNIIQLMHTLKDERSDLWCLVFEILKCKELKDTLKGLSDADLRLFMYETLKALDYAHSKGIMHRDIKPQNILIDVEGKQVRVIDWGLATFYYPNEQYSVRVATRAFKAPELLVEHQQYHYAIDIWAFGCMFAGILYGKNFFFHGKDFPEQLRLHVECLGSEKLNAFLQKYNIKAPEFVNDYPEYAGKEWSEYVDGKTNKQFICDDSIDLLDKLLRFDPNERLTAHEAMQHKYFDEVRDGQKNDEVENENDAKPIEQ